MISRSRKVLRLWQPTPRHLHYLPATELPSELAVSLEEIDARLGEAERLRRHAEDRREPFWPERRRVERVPNVEPLRDRRSR
jgi:hypothetical protein